VIYICKWERETYGMGNQIEEMRFQRTALEILEQKEIKIFADALMRERKKIVIWGAGDCGHLVYDVLSEQNVEVSFFADSFHAGETDRKTGVEIIGIDTVSGDRQNMLVLISVADKHIYSIIHQQLKEAGLEDWQLYDMKRFIERLPVRFFIQNRDKYQQVYTMLEDDFSKKVYLERMKRVYLLNDLSGIVSPVDEEYFDKVNILSGEEVFIDCGGYDGDTSLRLINRCKGRYKKIIVFEPELSKKEAIERNLKGTNHMVYPYGAWKKEGMLCFDARGDAASRITIEGSNSKVQVVALDDYIYDEKPTFIKMDIEGAELEALIGARKTIQTYKPKLAVCLYHRPQDLFEIPLYLKSLEESYRLYIRQYANSRYETVCYAV